MNTSFILGTSITTQDVEASYVDHVGHVIEFAFHFFPLCLAHIKSRLGRVIDQSD